MPFQISPGVNVTEKDLTNIVPAVATTLGGFAGYFKWGPVEDVTLVDSEDNLVSLFGKPDNNNAQYWWTAANFLGYTNALNVVRKIHSSGANAVAAGNGTRGDADYEVLSNTGTSGLLLKNEENYFSQLNGGTSPGVLSTGLTGADLVYFGAKYPGALGNSLRVSMSDKHELQAVAAVDATAGASFIKLTAAGVPLLNGEVAVGDTIKLPGGGSYTVSGFSGGGVGGLGDSDASVACIAASVGSAGAAGTTANHGCEISYLHTDDGFFVSPTIGAADAGTGLTANVQWAYSGNFSATPDTSTDAAKFGAVKDEIHIAVVDEDGLFSGARGTVLETFSASKGQDAKKFDGTGNYYVNVINDQSKYIWWGDHPDSINIGEGASGDSQGREWGTPFTTIEAGTAVDGGDGSTFDCLTRNFYGSMTGGHDGDTFLNTELYTNGYDKFADAETIDCSLLLGGPAHETLAGQLIDLVDARKDCVAFLSPRYEDCVERPSVSEAQESSVDYYNNTLNKSSSYGVFDSGWKYQYDRYNDIYRWVPLNGDIAGL